MGKYRLEDLSWFEVQEALEKGTNTILIMIGAIEQHGPHLPLSTDSLIAEKIGIEIVHRLGNTLLAPIINVGASEYHMDFPGTVSIREEILKEIIIDYCRCFFHHGFRNIIVIPTHSGNCNAIDQAIKCLKIEMENKNIRIIGFINLMDYFKPIYEASSEIGISSYIAGPHAGEAETSMILAINPDLVQMDRAKIGYIGNPETARPVVVAKGTKFVAENGIFGDPTKASKEHGLAYISSLINYLITFIHTELYEKENK